MQPVNITFIDNTKGFELPSLNTILLLDTSQDLNLLYTDQQSAIVGVPPAGVTVTSDIYELFGIIQQQRRQKVFVFGADASITGNIDTRLNDIDKSKFFMIVSNTTSETEATEIKTWCASNDIMFGWTPSIVDNGVDTPISTIASCISLAQSWNTEMAFMALHPGDTTLATPEHYNLAVGWVGKVLPLTAGSATWAYKSVDGMPYVKFKPTEQSTIENAKTLNWVEEHFGDISVYDGRTTAKTYIDITQSKYWLKYQLQLAFFSVFKNNPKVGFTIDGKALIKNAIDSVISQAETIGILAPGETVISIPEPLEVPTNDRANRVWTNIVITSRIQGAVHSADVVYILNA